MANTMNVLPRRISPKWLEDKGACGDQVKLFAGEWPDGCDVTETNLRRAGEIGMLLEWLADRALPRSLYADYQAKRAPLDADDQAKREALLIGFLWPYYESHVAAPETLPEFESVADTQKAGATN